MERFTTQDDVIKWKHFLRYWPFVQRIYRSPVNFPHKGPWRGALMFYLICVWTNNKENNRDAGDLKRHGAHYDVTLMHLAHVFSTWTPDIPLKPLWQRSCASHQIKAVGQMLTYVCVVPCGARMTCIIDLIYLITSVSFPFDDRRQMFIFFRKWLYIVSLFLRILFVGLFVFKWDQFKISSSAEEL